MTAALGSASGGRANAAAIETATTDARTKAQAAYDAAKAELDALTAAKPATELQALIEGAKAELAKLPGGALGCRSRGARSEPPSATRSATVAHDQRLAGACPARSSTAELARARQRERLTAKIAGWT